MYQIVPLVVQNEGCADLFAERGLLGQPCLGPGSVAHGPAGEGLDSDHNLQVNVEPGGWHAITLTLTDSQRFIEAFGDSQH
jgi:hypothetical protein